MKPSRATFLLIALLLSLSSASSNYAAEAQETPFEKIAGEEEELEMDVTDGDANELIPQILQRTGLQYAFIRSNEERLISIKAKAQPALLLETVAFAAGFNIHKNGNYWVIHPLPLQEDPIEEINP